MQQTEIVIKVRGYHLDIYGHVNNARYLEFLEEARWDFLEHQDGLEAFTKAGIGLAVVNININYRRPAFVNEQLVIRTRLSQLGQRSAVMRQEVVLKDDDTSVADADITFVMIDRKTHKAVDLEGKIREQLEDWMHIDAAVTN